MKKVIQSQRPWKEFTTNGNVGLITTKFSEEFIEKSYKAIHLSVENFQEEVELNNIDTLFIDNDLYESDHEWYRKNRGHIINYFKNNNNKNICVIKNTSADVFTIFKKAFILEIEPSFSEYKITDFYLQVPLVLDTSIYNPINYEKTIDITYYCLGKSKYSPRTKAMNLSDEPKVKVISEMKYTRKSLETLIESIKKSRVLYLVKSSQIDSVTLNYIETIALLNSTYVIYENNFEVEPMYGFKAGDFKVDVNKISVMLKNPSYTLKKTVNLQRKVLLNNTFLTVNDFKGFINTGISHLEKPKISIITSTNREDNLKNYIEQINKQKYVDIEINIVTHGFELNDEDKNTYSKSCKFEIGFTYASSSVNLGVCLNRAIDKSIYPVISKIDDDDYYLDYYLIDQWLALNYSNADIVGKSESYYYFENEDIIALRKKGEMLKFGDFVMGATLTGDANIFKDFKFADLPKAVDTNFLKRILEKDKIIYINHPYEMCVYRTENETNHTWKVNNLAMLKSAEIVGYGNPKAYVSAE